MKTDKSLPRASSLRSGRALVQTGFIFAFNHPHKPGDICSIATCTHASMAPALIGDFELDDLPQLILRESTEQEYLSQPVPEGWVIPPLDYSCEYFYEVHMD